MQGDRPSHDIESMPGPLSEAAWSPDFTTSRFPIGLLMWMRGAFFPNLRWRPHGRLCGRPGEKAREGSRPAESCASRFERWTKE